MEKDGVIMKLESTNGSVTGRSTILTILKIVQQDEFFRYFRKTTDRVFLMDQTFLTKLGPGPMIDFN